MIKKEKIKGGAKCVGLPQWIYRHSLDLAYPT